MLLSLVPMSATLGLDVPWWSSDASPARDARLFLEALFASEEDFSTNERFLDATMGDIVAAILVLTNTEEDWVSCSLFNRDLRRRGVAPFPMSWAMAAAASSMASSPPIVRSAVEPPTLCIREDRSCRWFCFSVNDGAVSVNGVLLEYESKVCGMGW